MAAAALPPLIVKARNVHEAAVACDDVRAIYDSASKVKKVMLVLSDTRSGFLAEANIAQRQICINKSLSVGDALPLYVFELLNITAEDEFKELFLKAKRGEIGREAFAYAGEKIEHANALKHHLLMQKGVQDLGWHPNGDFHSKIDPNFDTFWKTQSKTAHADHWRKLWDSLSPPLTILDNSKNSISETASEQIFPTGPMTVSSPHNPIPMPQGFAKVVSSPV
jgi:hypothetical protein